MPSVLRQLYFDIMRGRLPAPELICRVVARTQAADLDVLAEVTADPLAFAALLRAARGTGAEARITALAQEQLDLLGLDILRPADVINTLPAPQLARARLFG